MHNMLQISSKMSPKASPKASTSCSFSHSRTHLGAQPKPISRDPQVTTSGDHDVVFRGHIFYKALFFRKQGLVKTTLYRTHRQHAWILQREGEQCTTCCRFPQKCRPKPHPAPKSGALGSPGPTGDRNLTNDYSLAVLWGSKMPQMRPGGEPMDTYRHPKFGKIPAKDPSKPHTPTKEKTW